MGALDKRQNRKWSLKSRKRFLKRHLTLFCFHNIIKTIGFLGPSALGIFAHIFSSVWSNVKRCIAILTLCRSPSFYLCVWELSMCSRLKYMLLQSRTEQLPCKSSDRQWKKKFPCTFGLWITFHARTKIPQKQKKNVGNVNSVEVSEVWFCKLFQIFFEKYFRNFSKSQLKIHLMY